MPKKTVAAIVDSGNHYMIGLKGNQPNLWAYAKSLTENVGLCSSSFITIEINKGRSELRHVMVGNVLQEDIPKGWQGVKQIVRIQRIVRHRNKREQKTEENFYFISSRSSNAFYYMEGIRSHWAIENSLHRVKDVTMNEDSSTIRTGNAPVNFSTIKNIALNILRTKGYNNIASAARMIAHDIPILKSLIS